METNKNLVLAAVIAILLIGGVIYWFFGASTTSVEAPSNEVPNEQGANLPGNGVLSVVADKESYTVGDEVTLSFFMNTDVPVVGTDVIVMFDGTILEVAKGIVAEDFSAKSSQTAFVAGASKKEGAPVINYTNSVVEEGTVRYTFSALALPGEEIQGKVPLGSLTLRAKKSGEAPVTFFFEGNGVSTDSNIVHEGRDILKTVEETTVRVES